MKNIIFVFFFSFLFASDEVILDYASLSKVTEKDILNSIKNEITLEVPNKKEIIPISIKEPYYGKKDNVIEASLIEEYTFKDENSFLIAYLNKLKEFPKLNIIFLDYFSSKYCEENFYEKINMNDIILFHDNKIIDFLIDKYIFDNKSYKDNIASFKYLNCGKK